MVNTMKKTVFALFFMLIFAGGCVNANTNNAPAPEKKSLMEYQDYAKINPEKITSLRIIRYTEAGANEKIIKDKAEITGIYNSLKNIKILGETQMSCTDNTTIYSFELADGSKSSIEIECDWVVIEGKNYRIR